MAYSELTSAPSEAQTIIDAALRSAEPAELTPGKVYAFHTPRGIERVDLTGDEYRNAPARKTGTTIVRDAGSWLAYYEKHHDQQSEVYRDVEALNITAVLDAHTGDAPRFGRHRVTLALRTTKSWQAWAQRDGKWMDQEQFAAFLEERLPDLVTPDAATMLEIAQSIQGSTKAQFQSGTRLATGERKFSYVEDTTAKAGARGELTIPEVFTLGVIPFEGADRYSMTARFRYRIERGGELRLGYHLEQPEDRLAAAFAEVADTIANAIDEPVMNGTPA
ncbi:DUF2303 family protein [Streptomyces tremellae]|uniref:DUF2303 family protein n=1 Tax=Streptomyces tremellae TaxID=1124239 RepID=A0ABP7EFT3_9ACTN